MGHICIAASLLVKVWETTTVSYPHVSRSPKLTLDVLRSRLNFSVLERDSYRIRIPVNRLELPHVSEYLDALSGGNCSIDGFKCNAPRDTFLFNANISIGEQCSSSIGFRLRQQREDGLNPKRTELPSSQGTRPVYLPDKPCSSPR